MADEQKSVYPFNAFNFDVQIEVSGLDIKKLCEGQFSECDGLEMTMDVKTIREGGNNGKQIRLSGPVAYGQLTLKRGMTASFDLWDWFAAVVNDPALRADAEVVLLAPGGAAERARFVLSRCVPVKLKAPPLNGTTGLLAIEEFQLAYESLTLKPPQGGAGAPRGVGISASVSVSVSAGASFGI